jgi:hypothetical protein
MLWGEDGDVFKRAAVVLRQRQYPGTVFAQNKVGYACAVTRSPPAKLPTPHVFNLAPMRLEFVADSPRISTEEFFNCTGRTLDSELLVMK